MNISRILTSIVAVVALTACSPKTNIQEGVHYKRHEPLQAVASTTNKIVVVEFFSYGCNHCADFNPSFLAWAKQNPDIEIRKIPVGFHQQWVPLQKLYFTLEVMGLEKEYGPVVFDAIHKDRLNLLSNEAILDWAKSQNMDIAKFSSTFSSNDVGEKVERANTLANEYKITGVPFVSVAGEYFILNENMESREHFISVIDTVAKQVVKK